MFGRLRDTHSFWTVLLYVLIGVGLLTHLWVAFQTHLWGDEVLSILNAKSFSFQFLLTNTIEAVHPNTFWLLLKLILVGPITPYVVRGGFYLLFCLGLILYNQTLKTLGFDQKNQRLVFLSLYVLSAYFLHFFFSIRMYAIGLVCLQLSLLCSAAFLRHRQVSFLIALILADLVGFAFVYGYFYWIVIKAAALAWFLWPSIQKKSTIKQLIFLGGEVILTLGISVWVLFRNTTEINTSALSWVPIPNFSSGMLPFLSLNGLGFFGFLEGYKRLTAGDTVINGIALSLLMIAIYFVCRYRKLLKHYFDQLHSGERYLLVIAILALGLYLVLFVFAILTGTHLFHIRQLFPIAFSFLLGVSLLLVKGLNAKKYFAYPIFYYATSLIFFGFVIVSLHNFYQDFVKTDFYCTYCAAMESLEGPVYYLDSTAVEVTYTVCQVDIQNDVKRKCAEKNWWEFKSDIDLLSQIKQQHFSTFHILGAFSEGTAKVITDELNYVCEPESIAVKCSQR